jgi:hypothetical protein
VAKARRSRTTGAPAARPGSGRDHARRVEKLLAGENLDTSGLAYDFEAHHIGFVAGGAGARAALEERIGATGLSHLVVAVSTRLTWGWVGRREEFEPGEVDALCAGRRARSSLDGAARLAIGEPALGLSGWRGTHHQARVALQVATRGSETTVRYGEVAILGSVLRDDLLAGSLRQLYLEPLEAGSDRGEELRRTLRAYFAAGRNVTAASEAVGVTRQAVAKRLRTAEDRLGRPLAACGADLEVALRFEGLEATPLSAL